MLEQQARRIVGLGFLSFCVAAAGACSTRPAEAPPAAALPTAATTQATPPASPPETPDALTAEQQAAREQADASVTFTGKLFADRAEQPPVMQCAPSGAEICGDGIDNDCDGRYDDVGCGYSTGILQWTLTWTGPADLDLHVIGPDGVEVSPDHPTSERSGIVYDRTCSGAGQPDCGPNRVENVYVSPERPPAFGAYLAWVEVRAVPEHSDQLIAARFSGRVGKQTWHTNVHLAPLAGATYRVAFATGGDSDQDGVVDEQDACRTVPGCWFQDPATRGCPDRDADGVPDSEDACPDRAGLDNTDSKKHGCPLVFGSAWVTNRGVQINQRIEFAFGRAEIQKKSQIIIENVARALQSQPSQVKKIAVEGHTDSVGDDQSNLELSNRRAHAVLEALAGQGVPRPMLVPHGYGETKPIADNDTEAGRQSNRRVEFAVIDPRPYQTPCW